MFQHACQLGCEGIVSKRLGLALPLRPLAGLAQVQEPGGACGQAGGGRGLAIAENPWRIDDIELIMEPYASDNSSGAGAAQQDQRLKGSVRPQDLPRWVADA